MPSPLPYENLSDTYIEAMQLIPSKKTYETCEIDDELTQKIKDIADGIFFPFYSIRYKCL